MHTCLCHVPTFGKGWFRTGWNSTGSERPYEISLAGCLSVQLTGLQGCLLQAQLGESGTGRLEAGCWLARILQMLAVHRALSQSDLASPVLHLERLQAVSGEGTCFPEFFYFFPPLELWVFTPHLHCQLCV